MSVTLNHTEVDIVQLNLEQSGDSSINITTRDIILNSNLDYIFAVDQLDIDTSNLPIFEPTLNDTLFTIKKRRTGLTIANLENADFSPTFTINAAGRRFFDTSTFLMAISEWANQFSTLQDAHGIDAASHHDDIVANYFHNAPGGQKLLQVGVDGSGRLTFTGLAQFWNNFVIVFSNFAKKMLKFENLLEENVLAATTQNALPPLPPLPAVSYSRLTNGLFLGVVVDGGNTRKIAAKSRTSIYSHLDQRLYLEVTTDLPIARKLKITESNENTDVAICRVPFLNDIRTVMSVQNDVIQKEHEISIQSYVGRHSFVKKTEAITDWNVLKTSYDQRVFRFSLYIVWNMWDGTKQIFEQTAKQVDFKTDEFWNMGIRFISRIK